VFRAFGSDPEVTRYLTWPPHREPAEAEAALAERIERMERGVELSWMLEHARDGGLVGIVSAWLEPGGAELGFVLARSAWGHGLATEAVRAVCRWALACPDVTRVWATCDAENGASARVLEKAGLTPRGRFERDIVRVNLGPEPRPTRWFEWVRSVRPYQPGDEVAVVDVWHRSGRAAYPYLPTWQAFSREHAGRVFREVIAPACEIWVGNDGDRVAAYLALEGDTLDRLYVDPPAQQSGWGTRLVEQAKRLRPSGMRLHTHQQNHAARALYERHKFQAVAFGTSPPPESAPDVEYHWRPGGSRDER